MPSDTLRQITGTFRAPDGSVFANQTLTWFRERREVYGQGTTAVLDQPFFVTVDNSGTLDFEVMPGRYLVMTRLDDADRYFYVNVPDQVGPFDIATLIVGEALEPSDLTAFDSLVNKARLWASAAEGVMVEDFLFSARHYALKSKSSEEQVESDRSYVEARAAALEGIAVSGVIRKAAVACATTANITLSGEKTIDGVTTSASRVLVKNQSTAAENGIYVSASGAWSRASDMNAAGEVQGAAVYVTGGTANAGKTFYTGSEVTALGTDAIAWVVSEDQGELQARVDGVAGSVDERTPSVKSRKPARAPMSEGAGQAVGVWWDDGFAVSGLAQDFVDALEPYGFASVAYKSRALGRAPLAVDKDGRAAAWVSGGVFGFVGGSDNAAAKYAPATDGRDIARYLSKSIALKEGGSGEIKFGFIGDSWTEFSAIPQAARAALEATFARSGDGFFSGKQSPVLTGYTLSASGWTVYDSSNGAAPPRSCGPDGNAAYTTGTTAIWSVSGLNASRIRLLYWDGDGTFRYRIDGGAWVTVAGSGADEVAIEELAGLTNAASVEIDTTTNAGTVEYYGLIADNPGADGLTVYKIGNGAATGQTWGLIEDHLTQWSATLGLDVSVIILGTNDTRLSGNTPATLASGIGSIVSALRSSNDTMGACYIYPPAHGGAVSGNGTFSEFRDAAIAACDALGIDYVNALDRWLDHAAEDAAGYWTDTLHLTNLGAARLMKYDTLPMAFKEYGA